MKLSDKKFAKNASANKSVNTLDKAALRAALSPTTSLEAAFDLVAGLSKDAQLDVMAPAMGVPAPQPQKTMKPVHEGMWLPREIKKHYRRLRSMGYGINDADMAIEDALRQGAGGAGGDDERVKDFLRRMWYATISTKPHEESLYKLANSLYAQAMPPAPPAPAPVDPMAPPPAGGEQPPMDGMEEPESDMPLEDALLQLEEAAKAVIQKVNQGETVLNGENLEPIKPEDTGSIPSPSPKVAQIDDDEPMPGIQRGKTPPQAPHNPNEHDKGILDYFNVDRDSKDYLEKEKLKLKQEPPKPPPVMPKDLSPYGLKGIPRPKVREMLNDSLDQGKVQIKHLNPTDPNSGDPSKYKWNTKQDILEQIKSVQNDMPEDEKSSEYKSSMEKLKVLRQKYDNMDNSPDSSKPGDSKEREVAKRNELTLKIKKIEDVMREKDMTPELREKGAAEVARLREELDMVGAPAERVRNSDPVAKVNRQYGPMYERMKTDLQRSGVPAEQAAQIIDDRKTVDIFQELLRMDILSGSTGKKHEVKTTPSHKVVKIDDEKEVRRPRDPHVIPDTEVDANPNEISEAGGKFTTPDEMLSRDTSKYSPAQQALEFAPDRGTKSPSYKGGPATPGKHPVKLTDSLGPSLDGDDNVQNWIWSLPRKHIKKPNSGPGKTWSPDGGATNYGINHQMVDAGIDVQKLTPKDLDKMREVIRQLMPTYEMNMEMIENGMKNKKNPNDKSTTHSRSPSNQTKKTVMENFKNMPKKSVDSEAKDYYHDLYGDYGDDMTRDRIAEVADSVVDIFEAHGVPASSARFARIVEFIADYSTMNTGKLGELARVASADSKFASVVDRILANHILSKNADLAFMNSVIPSTVKASLLGLAMQESNSRDRLLSYVAAKMKTPKPKGRPSDEVKVDAFSKDEADKNEPEEHNSHCDMEVDDMFKKGDYVHMVISWDCDSDAADKSEEGMKHAVISFLKGLESTKEVHDIGFLGKIHFEDFDASAGVAEVYFMSTRSGDADMVVRED